MPLSTYLKDALAVGLSRSSAPIVVNSFGRSGSTLLYGAVAEAAARGGEAVARRVVRGNAWDLQRDRLHRGRVYKSHDYPRRGMRRDARVLYVFGDPLAAVHSLIDRTARDGQVWLDMHADHFAVPRFTPDELYTRDALGVTAHLNAWLAQTDVATAFVRYESLWEHLSELSDFVGFPVELPARRNRTSAPRRDSAEFREVYKEATTIVDSLPNWSVRKSNM